MRRERDAMLNILHIENIAVIERADIAFDAGLNVLTGETGAGKSIVIDALGAALGSRASRELVRTGSSGASVGAVFSGLSSAVTRWSLANGFPEPEDGEISVQRDIHADGHNTCRIGGRPATVAQLRELGALLVSISGQNDSYTLLAEQTHLEHLNAFAQISPDAYREAYGAWREILREMDALRMSDGEKASRMDALRFAVAELEEAELEPGEEAALLARRKLLLNGAKLIQAAEDAYEALFAEDDAACTQIARVENSLRAVSGVSEPVAELLERAQQLRYAAGDIAEDLGALISEFDFSPEEQDEVEGRLALIGRLTRKYGGSEEAALAFLEESRAELESIGFSEQRLETLEKREREARVRVQKLAGALTKQRRDAAVTLQARLVGELAQLDMGKVRFEARVESDPDELGPDGADSVRFLISTNVGEPLRPIAKVASGGELARILLALKNVLSGADEAQTLVFDEVDAGVSGRAAQRVAEKLADVAQDRQVLSVTHLPQIAAMADSHFHVEKGEAGGRTLTHVLRLDKEGRAEEIARITGGAKITETTRRSASELIDAAAAYKNGL